MMFGLTLQQKQMLNAIFEQYLPTGKVVVYGSRAKGNYTNRSDLDLAIEAKYDIKPDLAAEIKEAIDDSDFPYMVDIQFIKTIKNKKLLAHIERVGLVLYEK